MSRTNLRPHGGVRGDALAPGSPLFEGRFGRIFRALPPARFAGKDPTKLGHRDPDQVSVENLGKLARAMTAAAEVDANGRPTATPESEIDDEENQGIDAGYTYLGQFIDHDLTFDPASSLQKQNDPDALTDFRTPRFDLDNMYGRGPADQPYLYDDDGLHFLLGRTLTGSESDARVRDVPRRANARGERSRALIGDPRNDENVVIAQLQATMLRFHNRVADFYQATPAQFDEIQRIVRWHYQWVVLHDFLPTIVGQDTVHEVLPHLASGKSIYEDKPNLLFFDWKNNPFIPIEFSAAAYRFGHSMVRPIYRLNTKLVGDGSAKDPINGRLFIFTPTDGRHGLNGFREFPSDWAIDWNLFFDMGDARPPTGITRVQKAYKIDSSLVNPLGTLPTSVATDDRSLASRNLKRGFAMGLPSGQDVARYMDLTPISDDVLRVGKATEADTPKNPLLTTIVDDPDVFADNAPLWYYILAEAQQGFRKNETAIHLGRVGGRIVAEVFIGLLLGDRFSFLSQSPGWKPESAFMANGTFGMAQLIKQARET